MKLTPRQIALTSLFIALGIMLPFVFHQFALAGRIFLPMHIPVLLAGIFVGPIGGAIVGLVCPGISFLLTGMPPPYAVPLMTIELFVYGLCMGFLSRLKKLPLWLSLVLVMILGRLAFTLGLLILGGFLALPLKTDVYLKTAFITGLPGIAIQLVLIPSLVKGVEAWKGK